MAVDTSIGLNQVHANWEPVCGGQHVARAAIQANGRSLRCPAEAAEALAELFTRPEDCDDGAGPQAGPGAVVVSSPVGDFVRVFSGAFAAVVLFSSSSSGVFSGAFSADVCAIGLNTILS